MPATNPAPATGPVPEMAVCALAGCDAEFPRRQGGRPRLYCSDAHRAEARRRRVASPEDPETLIRRLVEALGHHGGDGHDDVVLAQVRAETATQVARARAETAAALARAEEAEAVLAEREAELAEGADALAEVRAALAAAQDALARANDEATFARHAAAERAAADLALVRAEHMNERESWAEERRALLERLESARYEAARAQAAADAASRRGEDAHALAEEMRSWAETALASERQAEAARKEAERGAQAARKEAVVADAERRAALQQAETAQAALQVMTEERDRLGRTAAELESILATERLEAFEQADVLRRRLAATERALHRRQLRAAMLRLPSRGERP